MAIQSKIRKAVYTFMFGDYDDLKSPTVITPGWDYICFTDNPAIHSEFWDVRLSQRDDLDSRLEVKKFAMKHMILFHQYLTGYDLSLSIGAQLEVNCDLDELLERHFRPGDDMMVCRHSERDCIFDEAQECSKLRLDDPARIDAQMQRYRAKGYPAQNGLYTSLIIARWHDRPNLRWMCDFWWKEYQQGSRRDQLSFNYAIWKSPPVKISVVDYDSQFVNKPNFVIHPHKWKIRLNGTTIKMDTSSAFQSAGNEQATSCFPEYTGQIDSADFYAIRGWAADRSRPNTSINVSLYDGERLITTMRANQLRTDVGSALGDSGLHGFVIPTPDFLKDGAVRNLSIRL